MSSTVRFISDLHFGHKNMAILRGFKDVSEHDEYIVSKWNETVLKKDVTYILGDITMESSNYEILNRLNGIKKVVLGNHDLPKHIPKLMKYVNSVSGILTYKQKSFGGIILSHIPIHPRELRRFKYNIHGHLHLDKIEKENYINVSAEYIEYKPKTLEELGIK